MNKRSWQPCVWRKSPEAENWLDRTTCLRSGGRPRRRSVPLMAVATGRPENENNRSKNLSDRRISFTFDVVQVFVYVHLWLGFFVLRPYSPPVIAETRETITASSAAFFSRFLVEAFLHRRGAHRRRPEIRSRLRAFAPNRRQRRQ